MLFGFPQARWQGLPVSRLLRVMAVALCLGPVCTQPCQAQAPFELDLSMRRVTKGLRVPLQLDMDAAGVLYAGSGLVPHTGSLAPVYAINKYGASRELALVEDPDALAVGPNGMVYTGAFNGRIFEIDPATGTVSLWRAASRLGNIDGLKWFNGDLYTVAIDHPRCYRVDGTSQSITLFADFTAEGFTGMTGIEFDPNASRVFFGSPWENRILETDLSGVVTNSNVADGFQFVGHLEFDRSGNHGTDLFIADNGAGEIWRLDVQTGVRTLYVWSLVPRTGGLKFDASGRLLFSRLNDSGTEGEVWRDAPMSIGTQGPLPKGPKRLQPFQVVLDSPADADGVAFLVGCLDDTGTTMPSGRPFPLGPEPVKFLGWMPLDGTGHGEFDLSAVVDLPALRGVTFHLCAVTVAMGHWEPLRGITSNLSITVPANHPPVPVAPSGLSARTGFGVTLDGSGSYDLDLDPMTWRWLPGDGSLPLSGPIVEHAYATAGLYQATLRVSDGFAIRSTQVQVDVKDNTPCVADAGPDLTVTVSTPVSLDGSGSSDADGDPLVVTWDPGDGSPPQPGMMVTYTYTATGTYTATVTVTDGYSIDTDTATITVQ